MRRAPEVDRLLERLVDGQRAVLGPSLLGSYLFGSVATDHDEAGISDVDTTLVFIADIQRLLG
ncbi:MAG: hypothetical protein ACXWFU_08620 [Actinomycetota bacterium]